MADERSWDAKHDHPITWQPSATFLKGAVGFIVAGNAAFSLAILLFTEGQALRAVFSLAFMGVGGVAWILLRRERVAAAVWVLGVGIWLVITWTSYLHGGVRSTAILFYPLVIVLSGWMGGVNAAMPVALASVAATFLFVVADWAGVMPDPPLLMPLLRWLIEAFVFVFSAFLIRYVIRSYRNRLAEVRSLGIALARRSAEVEQLNVSLEQRVRERTAELERAHRELEEFSYTISHDMRGPLRSVVGFAGLLAESAQDRLDASERDLLARIGASGNRMNLLIDAVLEYLHLGRVALVRRPVALDAVAGEVVAALRERHPATQVLIHPLGVAHADAQMARRILEVLIGNALKFSAGMPAPRVEVGAQARTTEGGQGVEYFVRDNGIGFDMQHAEHLFNLFTRLNGDPALESTGAGLALVKRMIERHAGSIRAEAAPGQGATFIFSF